uniref:Uncharacterized protein n=1 Tax=Ciona intestinalis TaxID=7719 RepID=H2XKI2_CIOIN
YTYQLVRRSGGMKSTIMITQCPNKQCTLT